MNAKAQKPNDRFGKPIQSKYAAHGVPF